MGNEALRSSRNSGGSSPIRRSSSRRNSKSKNSNNGGQNYIAEDEIDRNNLELTTQTPKPVKRMEKIRRSLSFRRKKKSDKLPKLQQQQSIDNQPRDSSLNKSNMTTSASAPVGLPLQQQQSASNLKSNNSSLQNENSSNTINSSSVKPPLWIEDERRVRAGNCSFQVKYLGAAEVTDSRGMHLCEMAIEKLLAEKEKKKPIKAILYVSGDSLRVVDESNKTLLVDQTIEKVSFCAPDRQHENGFAYICRDGTTRRWLCHCFMAIKDTLKGTFSSGTAGGSSGGERLSHAVGCAFSVCLEKKQKRERENVSVEVGPNHSFTRFGSFRQASITERLEDPQIVMPAAEPVPIKQVENPHAIERPKPNLDAFNRQNSLRGTGGLQLPFKRNAAAYTSLKPGELPSFQQQKLSATNSNSSGQIIPPTKTSLLMQQHQQAKINNNNNNSSIPNSNSNQSLNSTPMSTNFNQEEANKINTINELPEESFTHQQHQQQNESNSNNMIITGDSVVQLNEQFNAQLSINTPPPQSLLTNQNNNLTSSVFTTPQSLPVTPLSTNAISTTSAIIPPPLPPMPAQYLYQTNLLTQQQQQPSLFYQTAQAYPHGTQFIHAYMPVQMPMQPQQLSMIGSPVGQGQIPAVYTTPLQPPALITTTNLASASSAALSLTPNVNETFEQKWSRLQAKKIQTNPFAEDIAKKFEIKL